MGSKSKGVQAEKEREPTEIWGCKGGANAKKDCRYEGKMIGKLNACIRQNSISVGVSTHAPMSNGIGTQLQFCAAVSSSNLFQLLPLVNTN